MASASASASDAAPPPALAFGLPYDGLVAFATRALRMLNYGAIAPVFFLYCLQLGLSEVETGTLLTCILVGDLAITLWLTTRADAMGRRATLVVGALLKVLAGAAFALSSNYVVLVAAGIVGVISTSGGECGPFQAVEGAVLADAVRRQHEHEQRLARAAAGDGGDEDGDAAAAAAAAKDTAGRVAVMQGYYQAAGYLSQAAGALASGLAVSRAQAALGMAPLDSYRLVFFAYGAVGGLMALLYATLSARCEVKGAKPKPCLPCCPAGGSKAAGGKGAAAAEEEDEEPSACLTAFGLRRPESAHIVLRLCVLFVMDSFAGAFVMQTWIAYWFDKRWAFGSDLVGYLLMASNVVAGVSGVAAAYFVKKYGPMLTMVASHFPSNLLLLAVPFMPTGWAAAAMLVARFCISQMDVPARNSYVTMVVAPGEMSAANGITNLVRSLGMAAAPSIVGYLSSAPADPSPLGGFTRFGSPWLIAGVIKCVYDLSLYGLYLRDATMRDGIENAAKRNLQEASAGRARDKAAAAEAGRLEGRDFGSTKAPLLEAVGGGK